ncbi:hypothetical protein FSP39_025117 [Pinctada imbricata]|uniref:Death domain-containing protein n=1 Tax=Pinctada imbricata TaxID=66713 RepID=A0AA88XLT2_PINIB|nr:hypothetical protein FSP39_025117 [Pinctada imbricata]
MSGYVRLDLVDFAGQFIFYTTHQAYLTSRGLYLLVFNLAMGLDGEVMDDDVHAGESIQRRVIDFLKFWISTIVTYARSEDNSFPKIILIGTHRDKVKDASQLLSIKSDIEAHFPQMIRSSQLIVREDLFISALPMTDKTKATIRGVILEQGMAYREFGEPIPRSWIALQEKLMKMKKKGRCIATKEEVMQMNRTLENPLDEEEMEIFLKYLHNIGYILHFPSPVLQEKIILDPIVVINAMKSFITCDSFIKSKRIRGIFDRMQRCGEVKISDICNMWKGKEVANHSDHLLAVMQKLDIICEPTIYKGGQKISADFYVVPSMIKSIAPDGSVTNASAESQLVVVFSSLTILPPAIFHRLVCSCLALWTLFEEHIYHGFVALRVGRQHIMELRRHQNKILITFSHAEATKKPDVHLCLTIKLFLSETIDRILKIYSSSSKDHLSCSSPGLDAELDTHCPSTSGNTDDRNTVCNCDEFSNSELNDVNLIRIAEHLQGIHLSTFCSVLLNNAGFESQIQHNYGSFNYDVKLFYVLQKWKKQGNSTVMRLRQLFENHLEHVNKHLIYDALDQVVKLKQVYPEFLDATAQRISYKYIHLGLELGVPLSVIERLRLDKNSTLEIFRGILDHWHNARKGDATVLQLVTALNRCGETEISWINNEYETKRVMQREEETQPESAKSRCRVS